MKIDGCPIHNEPSTKLFHAKGFSRKTAYLEPCFAVWNAIAIGDNRPSRHNAVVTDQQA
jgi:hypothetical protein